MYIDFGDFAFYRMNVERVALNGGFGKAFEMGPKDIAKPIKMTAEPEKLTALIDQATNMVVLTGAGISTEFRHSGFPVTWRYLEPVPDHRISPSSSQVKKPGWKTGGGALPWKT